MFSKESYRLIDDLIGVLAGENHGEAARLILVRQDWLDRDQAEREPPTDRRSVTAREHLAKERT